MKERKTSAQTRMIRLSAEMKSWETVMASTKNKELRDFAAKTVEAISSELEDVAMVAMVAAKAAAGDFGSPFGDAERHAAK